MTELQPMMHRRNGSSALFGGYVPGLEVQDFLTPIFKVQGQMPPQPMSGKLRVRGAESTYSELA